MYAIRSYYGAVINCGSTAFLLGQEICGQDVQVITNYFPLASYLIKEGHDGVVIIGGQYNRSQSITLAPQDEVSSLYAGHWMFTSGKGITADGLYKMDMLTAMAEQKMLDHVGKLVVLTDSSKVGQRAGMLFCPVTQVDILITGKNADPDVLQQIRDKGVEVILVPLLMPVVNMAGIDQTYFGLMFVINCSIGLITPPVGTVLNVVCGVAKVPMSAAVRGILPFILAYIGLLILFVIFPQSYNFV